MKKRIASLFSGLALALAAPAVAQQAPVLTLTTHIPLAAVSGRMDHLGVDVQGQRLFAAAIDNKTVEVVDLKAGKQVHTIADVDRPQAAFYDPASNRLFISCGGDGSVKIFDGKTFQLLDTVKLSADADNIRYDAHTRRVLVGYGGEKLLMGKVIRGQGDGALAMLDDSGKKTGEIAVDAHPESFQLEKNGTRVFINVPDRHEIQVADLDKKQVLAHWPVRCTDSFPMTLDEGHNRLFIGCREPASLEVFDTQSGKVVTSFPAPASDDIFYDAAKGRIYVLGNPGDAKSAAPGFMDVFQQKDPDHYAKIASYPTGSGAWTGFFVPEWGKLFVSVRHQGQQSAEVLVYEAK